MSNPTVLVAGGCGYIGTHTIVCLLEQNYDVVVVDNLVNSNAIALEKVAEIVGLSPEEKEKRMVFHKVDICDEAALRKVFESSPKFVSCIHFAGLKVRPLLVVAASSLLLSSLSHTHNHSFSRLLEKVLVFLFCIMRIILVGRLFFFDYWMNLSVIPLSFRPVPLSMVLRKPCPLPKILPSVSVLPMPMVVPST